MSGQNDHMEMELRDALDAKARVPGDQIRRLIEDVTEHIISTMETRLGVLWGEAEWERIGEALSEIELDLENLLPTITVWVPR